MNDLVAVMLYAWIGEAERFGSARELASYVGLVPSVRQNGDSARHGGITKQGSPQRRSVLVQAAHLLIFRCRPPEAAPLQAVATRTHEARARCKIAVVAAARHILRIAYYVLRDRTVYDPARLQASAAEEATRPRRPERRAIHCHTRYVEGRHPAGEQLPEQAALLETLAAFPADGPIDILYLAPVRSVIARPNGMRVVSYDELAALEHRVFPEVWDLFRRVLIPAIG